MYLVSLVDAVDELLRRGAPQEPDGRGVHSFRLHVLRGRGGHCGRPVMLQTQHEQGGPGGRRDERETLSGRSDSQAITTSGMGSVMNVFGS